MKLAALQTAFQDAILGETDEILAVIMPSRQLDSATRFAIYADAYRSRLAEFVANDYPVLHYVLGDEDFGALVAAYIDTTPSHHRNARFYAQDLPEFLRLHAPWDAIRTLAELASLERALSDAFDAADSSTLDAAALTAIAAEDQPRLSFTFHPSFALLMVMRGTAACYEAAVEGLAVPMPQDNGEETILVWRAPSLEPFYRLLDEDEALALSTANSGGSLDEICGLLSLRHDPATAAGLAALFLGRWFGDGLVNALSYR